MLFYSGKFHKAQGRHVVQSSCTVIIGPCCGWSVSDFFFLLRFLCRRYLHLLPTSCGSNLDLQEGHSISFHFEDGQFVPSSKRERENLAIPGRHSRCPLPSIFTRANQRAQTFVRDYQWLWFFTLLMKMLVPFRRPFLDSHSFSQAWEMYYSWENNVR